MFDCAASEELPRLRLRAVLTKRYDASRESRQSVSHGHFAESVFKFLLATTERARGAGDLPREPSASPYSALSCPCSIPTSALNARTTCGRYTSPASRGPTLESYRYRSPIPWSVSPGTRIRHFMQSLLQPLDLPAQQRGFQCAAPLRKYVPPHSFSLGNTASASAAHGSVSILQIAPFSAVRRFPRRSTGDVYWISL